MLASVYPVIADQVITADLSVLPSSFTASGAGGAINNNQISRARHQKKLRHLSLIIKQCYIIIVPYSLCSFVIQSEWVGDICPT